MSDKPDMKALAEQVRALAKQPQMQEIKRKRDALSGLRPENSAEIRQDLKEFGLRLRMQLGQRGQSGVEPSKPSPPAKRGRGRPPGPQYPEDSALITAMRRQILATGETEILPVARLFAGAARGSLDEENKARRLERAYRKRFGSVVERKSRNFSP